MLPNYQITRVKRLVESSIPDWFSNTTSEWEVKHYVNSGGMLDELLAFPCFWDSYTDDAHLLTLERIAPQEPPPHDTLFERVPDNNMVPPKHQWMATNLIGYWLEMPGYCLSQKKLYGEREVMNVFALDKTQSYQQAFVENMKLIPDSILREAAEQVIWNEKSLCRYLYRKANLYPKEDNKVLDALLPLFTEQKIKALANEMPPLPFYLLEKRAFMLFNTLAPYLDLDVCVQDTAFSIYARNVIDDWPENSSSEKNADEEITRKILRELCLKETAGQPEPSSPCSPKI